MPTTFCNTPISADDYIVKTERGHYRMSPFWIDTTCPRDMMDYGPVLEFPDRLQFLADVYRFKNSA